LVHSSKWLVREAAACLPKEIACFSHLRQRIEDHVSPTAAKGRKPIDFTSEANNSLVTSTRRASLLRWFGLAPLRSGRCQKPERFPEFPHARPLRYILGARQLDHLDGAGEQMARSAACWASSARVLRTATNYDGCFFPPPPPPPPPPPRRHSLYASLPLPAPPDYTWRNAEGQTACTSFAPS